jgi:hypothetical protein
MELTTTFDSLDAGSQIKSVRLWLKFDKCKIPKAGKRSAKRSLMGRI